eukprot:188884_1
MSQQSSNRGTNPRNCPNGNFRRDASQDTDSGQFFALSRRDTSQSTANLPLSAMAVRNAPSLRPPAQPQNMTSSNTQTIELQLGQLESNLKQTQTDIRGIHPHLLKWGKYKALYDQLVQQESNIKQQINSLKKQEEQRQRSQQFLVSMKQGYEELKPFATIESYQDLHKHQLDSKKHDPDDDIASGARFESDLRELTKSIRNSQDIDALATGVHYQGSGKKFVTTVFGHLQISLERMCGKAKNDYVKGRMLYSTAQQFQDAMYGMFNRTCSAGRLVVVKWAIELMSLCYLDLLRTKSPSGQRQPPQDYINYVFQTDDYWEKYVVQLPRQKFTNKKWNTLHLSISMLLRLLRCWVSEYPDEYMQIISEYHYKWIEWKIAEIGQFLYGKYWRWKCHNCGGIDLGRFYPQDGRFYCDFCGLQLAGERFAASVYQYPPYYSHREELFLKNKKQKRKQKKKRRKRKQNTTPESANLDVFSANDDKDENTKNRPSIEDID